MLFEAETTVSLLKVVEVDITFLWFVVTYINPITVTYPIQIAINVYELTTIWMQTVTIWMQRIAVEQLAVVITGEEIELKTKVYTQKYNQEPISERITHG